MFKKLQFLILIFLPVFSFSQITANFSTDNSSGEYCFGDTIAFSNTSTGDYVVSYWNFGDGYDTWAKNPIHIYDTTGTFTVNLTVTDNTGVSNTKSASITVFLNPTVSLVNNSIDQSITAETADVGLTFQWLFDSDTTNLTDTTVYYLESGVFTVIASNSNSCSSSASIKIDLNSNNPASAEDSLQIIVKNNILTPDVKDGANDVLFIDQLSSYTANCKVIVYNKWGQVVYLNENYSNFGGFEGKDNSGSDLDAGTYYYVITTENRKTATGFVDLIR